MGRSPSRVANKIRSDWWMSSLPETIATSAPPGPNSGGKLQPVPKKLGVCARPVLMIGSPFALRLLLLHLRARLLLDATDDLIDAHEGHLAECLEDQVGVFDFEFEFDRHCLVLTALTARRPRCP